VGFEQRERGYGYIYICIKFKRKKGDLSNNMSLLAEILAQTGEFARGSDNKWVNNRILGHNNQAQ
jgi:hypothetical protein